MENKNATKVIKEPVQLAITERFFLLKMKKDKQDIRFLRTLRYSRWDSAAFCWVISRKEENLTMIRNYFGSIDIPGLLSSPLRFELSSGFLPQSNWQSAYK